MPEYGRTYRMNMTNEQIAILAAGAAALAFLAAWLLTLRRAAKWRRNAETAVQQQAFLKEKHEQENLHAKLTLDQERAHHRQQMEREQAAHARELQERDRLSEAANKAVLEQFKTLATETLTERSKQLKQDNEEKMKGIITPLEKQLSELGKAVADARTAEAKNKTSLEEKINAMMEQTRQIGADAVNLAKALKGDSKMQGNWGEVILERILETSGFIRGKHFTTQTLLRDEEGKSYYADAVINLPDERHVIVDSKVSLTAYARYTEAQDDAGRQAALGEHVGSVRKHMCELAEKNYARLDPHCIGYVLMFIPNEASYMAALQAEPGLPEEALSKRLLLISPTNLLMALQLANNLWVNATRVESIRQIIEQGQKLYEKFALFQQAFDEVGDRLNRIGDSYKKAAGRLYQGNGNYLSQVEKLRKMGIQPGANRQLRLDNADPDTEDGEKAPEAE